MEVRTFFFVSSFIIMNETPLPSSNNSSELIKFSSFSQGGSFSDMTAAAVGTFSNVRRLPAAIYVLYFSRIRRTALRSTSPSVFYPQVAAKSRETHNKCWKPHHIHHHTFIKTSICPFVVHLRLPTDIQLKTWRGGDSGD